MPILYRYFELLILVYSNEHEPIHVHGRCQGAESKAELIVIFPIADLYTGNL
ncbi:MAG TPA: DUF4160 domain-containing protein [Chloroflexi bacterium]|nr:DUF4160 domain-containing protein [Chloroflexota bacterium]